MNAKFLTPAQTEVREIIAYYNQQRDGLGLEFAVELKQTLLRIRNYPNGLVSTFIKGSALSN